MNPYKIHYERTALTNYATVFSIKLFFIIKYFLVI